MEQLMDFKEIMKTLNDIKKHPEIIDELDSEMDKALKDIIKIERRHLYGGLDSTSVATRRKTIQTYLEDTLKNRES